jgi:hypothetical protein
MDSLELLRRDWDSEGKAFPDKKLCPLRQRSVNDRNYFGPCYGEKCAWWDSSEGRCGVSVVSVFATKG